MSTLARFRKAGGLMQLLQLIETSDADKQRHLLELVGQEDPGWACLIKTKRLTLQRILSWPDDVVTQVLFHLPAEFTSNLCHVLSVPEVEKVERCLPKGKRRDYERLKEHRPTQQERWVAQVKVIQTTRDLINGGILRLASFDPTLEIDGRIAS